MRVAIGGSRKWNSTQLTDWVLSLYNITSVNAGCPSSGWATGGWKQGGLWATRHRLEHRVFPLFGPDMQFEAMEMATNSDFGVFFNDGCPVTEEVMRLFDVWGTPYDVINFRTDTPLFKFQCECGCTRFIQGVPKFCPVCYELRYRIYDSENLVVV